MTSNAVVRALIIPDLDPSKDLLKVTIPEGSTETVTVSFDGVSGEVSVNAQVAFDGGTGGGGVPS